MPSYIVVPPMLHTLHIRLNSCQRCRWFMSSTVRAWIIECGMFYYPWLQSDSQVPVLSVLPQLLTQPLCVQLDSWAKSWCNVQCDPIPTSTQLAYIESLVNDPRTLVLPCFASSLSVVFQHWPIRAITNDITSILIGNLRFSSSVHWQVNDLKTMVVCLRHVVHFQLLWKRCSSYAGNELSSLHIVLCAIL